MDLWNALRAWNTPAACEMPAGVGGLISFHWMPQHPISPFAVRRMISHCPKAIFHDSIGCGLHGRESPSTFSENLAIAPLDSGLDYVRILTLWLMSWCKSSWFHKKSGTFLWFSRKDNDVFRISRLAQMKTWYEIYTELRIWKKRKIIIWITSAAISSYVLSQRWTV